MKKFILTFVMALVVSMTSFAQVYVGGNVNFSSSTYNDYSVSTFGIAPEIGYEITPNFAVGTTVGYDTSKEEYEPSVNTFYVAPYLRLKSSPANGISVFVDGVYEYDNVSQNGYTDTGWGLGVRPGVSVKLAHNWSVAATTYLFSYTQYGDKPYREENTTFKFTPSNVSLGIYYHF